MTHWYTNDGEPMHYVPNKSRPGEMRETTLRDARKLNLNPSVTTVTKIVDKGEFLLEWTIKQALYAALVHPNGLPKCQLVEGVLPEDDPAFVKWAGECRADSKRRVEVKAERGSILHDMMMKAHHRRHEVEPQYLAHVDGMMAMLDANFGKRRWLAEITFAHPMGFGGSVDLHTPEDDPDPIILDYKFKDFGEGKRAEYFVYDEHKMQLGGYRIGLKRPKARCFNAFGSISEPGLVLLHPHTEADIAQGEAMFRAALALFQAKTGYVPKWAS